MEDSMLLEIEKPYVDMINKLISNGIAKEPEEVVRQSILAFTREFETEERYLVDKAVIKELAEIDENELIDSEDVFAEAGL